MPSTPKIQRTEAARVISCNAIKVRFSPDEDQSELQAQLQSLAKEIAAGLSDLEPEEGKALLGSFVSALFLSIAEEERREMRRQRQAEGIAAAKARGVHFGPQPKPLPEKFPECYKAWQDGEITHTQAAEMCGISRKAFYRAITRMKQAEDCVAG